MLLALLTLPALPKAPQLEGAGAWAGSVRSRAPRTGCPTPFYLTVDRRVAIQGHRLGQQALATLAVSLGPAWLLGSPHPSSFLSRAAVQFLYFYK